MNDELTQEQADYLLDLPKRRAEDGFVVWPSGGGKESVLLISTDGREEFMLDVETSAMKLTKLKLQNRARINVILVRLDVDGPGHRNPDHTEMPCPHIHLYREGYADKWAYPVPSEHFTDLSDMKKTVDDFMRFCRIIEPPQFIPGLVP